MADLNIRGIDAALLKELKQAAVEAGWTLKELCVHRLSGKTYGEIRRKAGPDVFKQEAAVREEVKARAIKARAIEVPVKMIIETPKVETPAPRIKTPAEAPARPAHAETCRCGICQLRRFQSTPGIAAGRN